MTDHQHDFPAAGEGSPVEIELAATGWRCRCDPACTPEQAARCLFAETLDALSRGEADAMVASGNIGPLAMVVASQRSAQGHSLCQGYIAALSAGDHAAALESCQRLIELAQTDHRRGWDDAPGVI